MKLLALLCSLALLSPAALPAQEPPPAALGWDGDKQSRFPTSLAADHAGGVWVGTEGDGVWRHDGKTWTQFTTKDGLGDDYCYALAVDKAGRVWAGHLRSGVSVWNGEKWRNFGLLDGPIGDHVFAIAVSPHDGDVWIATDAGLARWRSEKDEWDYYTRAAGLPADQVQALAFDQEGAVYAGMQCEGVAIAQPQDDYLHWEVVKGSRQPIGAPSGEGLPRNTINSVTAMSGPGELARSVVVGTPSGLGVITRGPQVEFRPAYVGFVRGYDYELNVEGLNHPETTSSDRPETPPFMLEDWVSAVGQSAIGSIWIGHRRADVEALLTDADGGDDEGGQRVAQARGGWTRAVLFPKQGAGIAAIYGPDDGGLIALPTAPGTPLDAELREKPSEPPPFPSPARRPMADSMVALQKRLADFKVEIKPGGGVFLGDDWRTQGDWVGRYGREYAGLQGRTDGSGEIADDSTCAVSIDIGPHQTQGGPFTYTNAEQTDDPRILIDPRIGVRRDSEINDGSWIREAYPWTWEGPDLLLTVTVPEGMHRVSLYMVNNDGHEGLNIYRDHEIELWRAETTYEEMSDSENEPLARARARDFYGGVYKQFAVRGPGEFILRIRRNHSFATKLHGVFIDPLPLTAPEKVAGIAYAPPPDPGPGVIQHGRDAGTFFARELWKTLDESWALRFAAPLQWPARVWAYRAAVAYKAPPDLLANWRWQLGIWTAEDRAALAAAVAATPSSQEVPAVPLPHEPTDGEGADATPAPTVPESKTYIIRRDATPDY